MGFQVVIASASEAIHWATGEKWIASSQVLLAMTSEYSFAISPRISREVCEKHPAF